MIDQKSANKNKFLYTLLDILNNSQYTQIISWHNQNGFIIKLTQNFEQQVLPKYFKQKSINSFMRQLNMYGFKQKKDYKSLHKIYEHPSFSNNRALLDKIQRKREHKKIRPKRKKVQEQIVYSSQEEVSLEQLSDDKENLKSTEKRRKSICLEKYEEVMDNYKKRLEMLEYSNLRICQEQEKFEAIMNNKFNIVTNQIHQIINILKFNIESDGNVNYPILQLDNQKGNLEKNITPQLNQINTIQNFLSKSTGLNNSSDPKIVIEMLKQQYQQQQHQKQIQSNLEPRKRKQKRTVSIKLENNEIESCNLLCTSKNFLKRPLPSFDIQKISQDNMNNE